MLSGLMLTALLMGVTGAPHCAAMCGTACAAAFRNGLPIQALIGRCIGYALLGGIAAASAGTIASWARDVAFLKPVWLIAQVLVVGFGVMMFVTGRVPSQMDQWGLSVYHAARSRWGASSSSALPTWVQPVAPLLAGLFWAVLPCGLLYGALMVAALAPDAVGGALVMTSFAIPGAMGVWAAPQLLRLLSQVGKRSADDAQSPASIVQTSPILWLKQEPASNAVQRVANGNVDRWLNPALPIRASGLMLAAMAGWGLAHHLWAQWQAWCG